MHQAYVSKGTNEICRLLRIKKRSNLIAIQSLLIDGVREIWIIFILTQFVINKGSSKINNRYTFVKKNEKKNVEVLNEQNKLFDSSTKEDQH